MIGFEVSMHRFRLAVVLVLAVLLAAQFTLHEHSLIPETGGATAVPCLVCAFGADPGALATPLFAAGLVLLGLAFLRLDVPQLAPRRIVLGGRAPPLT